MKCLVVLLVVAVAAAELEWWQKTIVYQIYPRSFKDSNGDGIGDLKGITEKLEYIKTLGVDTVWLSPIYKSPQADFGYDVSDYRDIDPIFGDMDDFDELLAETHKKGMYLVLDFVPNHSSDEHEWFIQSKMADKNPYSDYYVWRDGQPNTEDPENPLPPNNWWSNFNGGPAWTYVPDRKQFYLHQFHPKQPDLNYTNPQLLQEMKNVLRFWLDKGVDGFRMDIVSAIIEDPGFRDEPLLIPDHPEDYSSYDHIYTNGLDGSYEVIQEFRTVLDEYRIKTPQQPIRIMMTEAYTDIHNTVRWYGTAEMEGSHFPFNFGIISNFNRTSAAKEYVDYISSFLVQVPNGRWPDWVIGNHDQRRVASRFGIENIDNMNAFVLLLPGTAVTYNGEELGMEDNEDITYEEGVDPNGCNVGPQGYANKTRDFERSPFQWDNTTNAGFSSATATWLPVNKNYVTLNALFQQEAAESHLKFYQQVAALRRLRSVQEGSGYVNAQDDVLIIIRELQDSANVTAILNYSGNSVTVNVTNVFGGNRFSNYKLVAKSVGANLDLGTSLDPEQFLIGSHESAIFQTN